MIWFPRVQWGFQESASHGGLHYCDTETISERKRNLLCKDTYRSSIYHYWSQYSEFCNCHVAQHAQQALTCKSMYYEIEYLTIVMLCIKNRYKGKSVSNKYWFITDHQRRTLPLNCVYVLHHYTDLTGKVPKGLHFYLRYRLHKFGKYTHAFRRYHPLGWWLWESTNTLLGHQCIEDRPHHLH